MHVCKPDPKSVSSKPAELASRPWLKQQSSSSFTWAMIVLLFIFHETNPNKGNSFGDLPMPSSVQVWNELLQSKGLEGVGQRFAC